jgi:hypothetical protein
MTVTRETVLQVELDAAYGMHVQGWGRETGGVAVEVELDVAPDGTVTASGVPELVGHPVASGMRRLLAALPDATAEDRLLRRLLDDLPVLSRVGMQAALVDHPALPGLPGRMDLRGADQCSGWASDGTMLRQVAANDGVLVMRLTEPADRWEGLELPPLPAMATRRRRVLEVEPRDGVLHIAARFRDSYAVPDAVERGLHSYELTAELDGDGTVRRIDADGVTLPWPECWGTTDSAARLVGRSVLDVDTIARTDLVGLGTCTHLTDTLRTLKDAVALVS